jgi:cytochrome P450
MATMPIGPVRWEPRSQMWMATSHADCSAVLRDPRFSAARGQRERARDDELPQSMLTTDAPDHQRLRAPGSLLLGAAALRSVEGPIAEDVKGLIDGFGAGPSDVEAVERIGKPFATAVLSRLFGIGSGDRPVFAALAESVAVNLDPLAGPAQAAQGRQAMGRLTAYLNERTDLAVNCPLADLAADGRLSRPEMLGILGLAVVGGWQPLAEMVGNALFWILPRPDLVRLLIDAEPAGVRLVVDELLRLEAPIPFTMRVATEDVDLPGGRVPADGRVLVALSAANRDPSVFDRPDELVPTRSPNPHLAFGDGPHWCLAAQLARAAGALLLPALCERFPASTLGSEAAWDPRPIPRRLLRSPVTLVESR